MMLSITLVQNTVQLKPYSILRNSMNNCFVECGILSNNGTSGSIMTPGYPLTNYPNNVDCHFEILAPAGKSVRI